LFLTGANEEVRLADWIECHTQLVDGDGQVFRIGIVIPINEQLEVERTVEVGDQARVSVPQEWEELERPTLDQNNVLVWRHGNEALGLVPNDLEGLWVDVRRGAGSQDDLVPRPMKLVG